MVGNQKAAETLAVVENILNDYGCQTISKTIITPSMYKLGGAVSGRLVENPEIIEVLSKVDILL